VSTDSFLPETFIIPEDSKEKDLKIRQYLNDIAISTNSKDSGVYEGEEVVTGQRFIPIFSTDAAENATYRDVFRKVIDFGPLPSSGIKNIAHDISTDEDYSFVKIYGCATAPGVSSITAAIPLPFINTTTPGDSVQLNISETSIIITTTTANYSSFTRSFIVVEYITVI